jgi:UMF1 family MFS transporter
MTQIMNTKRNILLWVLYDFANSLVSIVFFLYFAQWVVIDCGLSDLSFNITFTLSTILLILTAPYAAVALDAYMRRIVGLRYATALTVLLYGVCAWCAVSNYTLGALVFFTLGMFAYQFSFTFYTPLITDITSPEKQGRVSGYGIAANYLGQCAGLLLVLPFSNGTLSLFGGSARAETLLPSVIAFAVLALPTLIWFKEPYRTKVVPAHASRTRNVIQKTQELLRFPSVGLFILAYFFFNDAILTAMNNFPLFLAQVWGVSDTIKTYLLLAVILTSALGGLASGFVADRYGHKRTMFFILSGWVIILPSLGFVQNFTLFVIATILMGFWFGANWAVSRSVMAYLAPSQANNLAFAYFNVLERTSSLVGPIVWGLVVTNLVSLGSYRYRLATLAITGFIIIGLVLLSRVKSDRPEASSISTQLPGN